MLDKVKESINSLTDMSFSEFYQEYILDLEDQILDYDSTRVQYSVHSIEDISGLVKGINSIVEELK